MSAERPRTPRSATWGGRLPGGLAPEAWEFLHSLPHDRFLWEADCTGTAAHVGALEGAGVLTPREAKRLRRELEQMGKHPELIGPDDEDVHSAIERVLTERLGDLGAKVHAGRSRNDQVVTALRLWARGEIGRTWEATLDLVQTLARRAGEQAQTIIPGYTHLQRAQPITVGHWMCAHAWAFVRDVERLEAAYRATDVSPLGAGALAGSTLGLDPKVAASELGFSRVFTNTLDAVSDRDFLCDATYAVVMAATHLSRLAEEVVIWSSTEFGFIDLPDSYATGSSMMPQKKNPDVAEVARAQTGPATGALVGLLSMLKALPLAYDRDLQTDKQNIQGVFASINAALRAMAGLVKEAGFNAQPLEAATTDDRLLATDLAEELVRRGVPFRRAHEQVAHVARRAADEGTSLREALHANPADVAPIPLEEALELLEPETSLRRRATPGGPSPRSVRAQQRAVERSVGRSRRSLERCLAQM